MLKRNPLWLGIDNGFNGAIAGLNIDKSIGRVHLIPSNSVALKTPSKKTGKTRYRKVLDEDALFTIFQDLNSEYNIQGVTIEEAVAMPGQSSQSTATTFFGYGFMRGILRSLKLPYRLIHPTVWTSAMFHGEKEKVKGGKERTIRATQEQYPMFDLNLKGKHPHDGVSDAILIALYGMQFFPFSPTANYNQSV